MTDLLFLPLAAILEKFRARTLSPAEYWEAVEARIAALEPHVQALYAYDHEGARAMAKASTERWAKGTPQGPLDGVPVSVKELIGTKGTPIPLGTAATPLVPVAEDAPAAARLREDGAVIYGKTTCPDYGMLTSGLSSFHHLSRNPWDLTKNPGGSSAGASAAGAAGFGPLHIGTDIGGSIRLPAGLTGLFGLKPSYGRIPIDPYYFGRVAGPMTRTVMDAALSMSTLTRPDWRDATSLPWQEINWTDLSIDVSGLTIGLMMDAGCGLDPDEDTARAVEATAALFSKAGARVVPVGPVMNRAMLDGMDMFWRAKFWAEIRHYPPERQDTILPYILQWAKGGADVSGADCALGYGQTIFMQQAAAALFQQVDAVISPCNPAHVYPADWASPINDPDKPFEHIGFTLPWNMAENPAASVNCGFARDGLPVGVQIVGPRFQDHFVMKLAQAVESWTGGVPHWPEPLAAGPSAPAPHPASASSHPASRGS